MDIELIELCKRVYELTGWESSRYISVNIEPYINGKYPLYTSDYLLEKLPYLITGKYGDKMPGVSINRSSNGWYVWYGELHSQGAVEDDGIAFIGFADTPLKALLKLTLVLKKVGKL